ncbi:MAG: glycosyltransferase family 39 protein [Candidatus Paceibacterota bacterium]
MKLSASWKKIILGLLLISAIFLRFRNLAGTLQFQGDQGRDAIVVADIFRQHDLVFIGPVTSVGNMYLGPLYYYFMLPFLWLSYPSPMGPVYAVAILGVVATYLIYKLGKDLIGKAGALLATFFFTFSATINQTFRFSWNPNPAPFVSIIMIWATYQAWKKNPRYWIFVAIAFSVLIQLHYMTLLTVPAAGVIWLADFWQRHRRAPKKPRLYWQELKKIILPTLIGTLIFLLSLTPLVLFDLKHGATNLQAFQNLLTSEENFTTTNVIQSPLIKITETIKETEGRGMHILFEYMIGKNRLLNQSLLYLASIGLLAILWKKHQLGKKAKKEWVLIAYLGFGILGTALYQHTIFDHYIAYLFPITVLIYGLILTSIKPRLLAILITLIFGGIFLQYNLPQLSFRDTGWTAADIEHTSQEILKHIQPGEKYNLVLLSESRDINGQNYRYFLTTGHTRPVTESERGTAETLFVINEEKKISKVTDSPIYEIVVFPNKEPAEVFNIDNGPEITVLRTTTQAAPETLE